MKCDTLVIGAGVLGLSSAYYIKMKDPSKRVIVIDMFNGPGQGNTAKSNACFRNVFASETNYMLSNSTIDWFKHIDASKYNLKLSLIGYLWLYSEDQYNKLESAFHTMEKRGVDYRVFNKQELNKSIPNLVTDFSRGSDSTVQGLEEIDIGVFGSKCGSLDADLLCRAYESLFLKQNGEIFYSTKANKLIVEAKDPLGLPGEPFVWQKACFRGAETDRGIIEADTTIVATGAWSEGLLNPVGVDPLMRPKKRQLFIFKDPKLSGLFDVKGLNELSVLPMTILPVGGVHFKTEPYERSIWLGCADNLNRTFTFEDDPKPEEKYYSNNIYHVLREYFPCFTDVRPVNMWAGHYEINSFDEIPVVVPYSGLIYVGASSGSGVMKCDALGRVVSAMHSGENQATLYGGGTFNVSDLGVHQRKVEKETFIL